MTVDIDPARITYELIDPHLWRIYYAGLHSHYARSTQANTQADISDYRELDAQEIRDRIARMSNRSMRDFWVARPDQAARLWLASCSATPSMNLTPSTTRGNWIWPRAGSRKTARGRRSTRSDGDRKPSHGADHRQSGVLDLSRMLALYPCCHREALHQRAGKPGLAEDLRPQGCGAADVLLVERPRRVGKPPHKGVVRGLDAMPSIYAVLPRSACRTRA